MDVLVPRSLRLLPGDDLKASLDTLVQGEAVQAGCILASAGSLTKAAVRLAGSSETVVLSGPLEIVSLTGTLSPDGLHLHLAVADAEGKVHGGHLKEGCHVHTTVEIVIGILTGVSFTREFDPATGFRELHIDQQAKEVTDDQG